MRENYSFDGATRAVRETSPRGSASSRSRGVAPVGSATAWRSSRCRGAAADRAYRARGTGSVRRAGVDRTGARFPRTTKRPFASMASASVPAAAGVYGGLRLSPFVTNKGTRVPNWREHLVCECGLNAQNAGGDPRVDDEASCAADRANLPDGAAVAPLRLAETALCRIWWAASTWATSGAWSVVARDPERGRHPADVFRPVLRLRPLLRRARARPRLPSAPSRRRTGAWPTAAHSSSPRHSSATARRRSNGHGSSDSGEIQHLLEPEFHGDPLEPEAGSCASSTSGGTSSTR